MTARHRAADTRKGRRRKTGKPKPRRGQTAPRSRQSAQEQLDQAVQQQSATAEVLRIIASSPGDLDRVFKTILENATRLCEANHGTLWLREGDGFRIGAMHNAPAGFAELRRRQPFVRPGPGTALGRVAQIRQVIHVRDITTEQAYRDGDPLFRTAAEVAGYRTLVSVPMLKESELIGSIAMFRQQVKPFTEKQIELVQNFRCAGRHRH
jgi:GAF domain-containing protein